MFGGVTMSFSEEVSQVIFPTASMHVALVSNNAGLQGGDAAGRQLFVPPPPARRGLGLLRRAPRIHILDDACGQANMGELVGVLGPSGTLPIYARQQM